MLTKIEGRKRRGQQGMRWLDGIIDSRDMNLSKLKEIVKEHQTPGLVKEIGKPCVLQPMGSQRVGYHLVTEQQQSISQQMLNTHLLSQEG